MCLFNDLYQMSCKVIIDDIILLLYASTKAGSWFLFKISALLMFSLQLINMHVTFDLYYLEERLRRSNRLNEHLSFCPKLKEVVWVSLVQ